VLQVLLPFLANTLASETAAPVLTAYQINTNVTGAEDCVASGTVGTFVSVNGYITALDTYGFYMQDDVVAAAHTGIYVYLATEEHASYDPTWASARVVGERVLVSALVDEYYGLSELNLRTSTDPSIVSVSTGNALTPLVTTTGGIGEACTAGGEAHEGILVTVTGVTIESVPNSFGEITINDGSGATQLEDSILDTDTHLSDALGSPLVGQTIESVTGVVRFAYGSFEIHPRDASDIVLSGGGGGGGGGGDASSATHTAYQINTDVTGSEACVASDLMGTFVTVAGYVTGLDTYGFYMQDGTAAAAHTGVYVYLGTDALVATYLSGRTVGEQVVVSALVDEYYGLSELNLRTATDPSIVSVSTGNALTPLVTTTGGIGEACTAGGEAHEGILVTVTGVTIESEPNSFGEITINDGSGATQLEDSILDTDTHLSDALGSPLVGQTIESVTGVVRFAYGSFEIHPRDASDIVLSGGGGSDSSLTLYQINYNYDDSDSCYHSTYDGTDQTVTGYITGMAYNGFFMMDSPTAAPYTGIWVYTDSDSAWLDVAGPGDQVTVVGTVTEYFELTEIIVDPDQSTHSVAATGISASLVPLTTTTGAIGTGCTASGEAHEGLLVTLTDVVLMSEADNYGQIVIDDGSGASELEDGLLDSVEHLETLLGSTALYGATLASLTGVVRFAFGSFEIHPRDASDVVVASIISAPYDAASGSVTVTVMSRNTAVDDTDWVGIYPAATAAAWDGTGAGTLAFSYIGTTDPASVTIDVSSLAAGDYAALLLRGSAANSDLTRITQALFTVPVVGASPSPPPPSTAPTVPAVIFATTVTAATFDADTYKQNLASVVGGGTTADDITLEVTAVASGRRLQALRLRRLSEAAELAVTATIRTTSEQVAVTIQSTLQSKTAAELTTDLGVTVTSVTAPVVTTITLYPPPPSPPIPASPSPTTATTEVDGTENAISSGGDDDNTAVIGGVVGGVAFLLLLAVLFLLYKRQQKPPTANLASAVPVEMMARPVDVTSAAVVSSTEANPSAVAVSEVSESKV